MTKRSKKKTSKPETGAAIVSAEALQFMVDQLGGSDAVNVAFAKLKFGEAVAAGLSLPDIIAEGKSAGWFQSIKDVPLSELLPRRKAVKGKRGRKPKAETAALRESILKTLGGEPQPAKEIAKAVNGSVRTVQTQLAKLVSEGFAKRQGSKRNATYSL